MLGKTDSSALGYELGIELTSLGASERKKEGLSLRCKVGRSDRFMRGEVDVRALIIGASLLSGDGTKSTS